MSDLREAIWNLVQGKLETIWTTDRDTLWVPECSDEIVKGVLALLREHRLVELDADQSLPKCLDGNRPRALAFRDMLKAGFKKVKEIA